MKFSEEWFVVVLAVLILGSGLGAMAWHTHRQLNRLYETSYALGCESVGNPVDYCHDMARKYIAEMK